MFFLFKVSISQCNWVAVGPNDFDNPAFAACNHLSLALDTNGVPIVAYTDVASNYKIMVRKHQAGIVWQDVGIQQFSAANANTPHIGVDPITNTAFIAYSDPVFSFKITVKKNIGPNWVNVGLPGFSPGSTNLTRIAFSSTGMPYVAYVDQFNGGIAVKSFNGTSWVNVGANINFNNSQKLFIQIDPTGTPFVASVNSSGSLTVLSYNGSSWVSVGTLSSYNSNSHMDFKLNNTGSPYIAYGDVSNGNAVSVLNYNGSAWFNVGSAGFSPANVSEIALAVNGNNPNVVFRNSSNTGSAMSFTGSNWVYIGSTAFTPESSAQNNLMFDKSGNLYHASRSTFITTMKYNGASWQSLCNYGFNSFYSAPNTFNSVVLDPLDNLHTVGSGTPGIIASVFTGSSFSVTGNTGFIGTSSSGVKCKMVYDGSGTPYVGVIDNNNNLSVLKLTGSTWQVVGSAGISLSTPVNEFDIAVDVFGVPYVLFEESSLPRVKKFISGSWTYVGASIPSSGGKLKLAINSFGIPYVAKYGSTGSMFVWEFNGTSWVLIGNFYSPALPSYSPLDLKTDATGALYLAYSEYFSSSVNYKLVVRKFSSGVWQLLGNSISPGDIWNTSLELDKSNSPIVAFADLTNSNKAVVKKWSGTSWQTLGSAFVSSGESFNTKLHMKSNNTLMISYQSAGYCYVKNFSNAFPLVSTLPSSITLCVGGNGILSSNPTYTGSLNYQWQSSTGSVFTNIINGTNYSGATTNSLNINNASLVMSGNKYRCLVISACDTLATSISTLNVVNNLPITITTTSTSVCPGQSTFLTALGAATYTWSSAANTSTIIVNPIVNTTYTVSGTNSFGCSGTNTIIISVNPTPTLSITVSSPTVCLGTSTNLLVNGANTYTWSTSSTSNSINVLPITTSTYSVIGTNTLGCSSTNSVTVNLNTTCSDVWPGDANSDGIANSLDVFEIGINFAQTGAARSTTNNVWSPFFANNWIGLTTTSKNMVHSDCNGDGIINLQDTLAIYNNYGFTHSFKLLSTSSSSLDISIYSDQTSVPPGNWGSASIYLGDTLNPINSLYGVSFDVVYDTSLIQTDSVYIEYLSSFLSSGGANILFRKKVFANSVIFAASVRSNLTTVSGYGKIAKLHYKIKPTALINSTLNLYLQNGKKTNNSGVINSLTTGSGTVNINSISTNIESLLSVSHSIYPNPSTGFVNLIGDFVQDDKIVLVNGIGQIVFEQNLSSGNNKIQISNLANGLYQYVIYRNKLKSSSGKIALQKL